MNIRVIEVEVVQQNGKLGVLEITIAQLASEDQYASEDIQDCIRVIDAKLFVDGVETELDIDVHQVYSVVSAAIREAGLNAMFNEEDGGF